MDELEPWEEIGWEGYAEQRFQYPVWKHRNAKPNLFHGKELRPKSKSTEAYKKRATRLSYYLQFACSCGKCIFGNKYKAMYKASSHRNRCNGTYEVKLVKGVGRGRKPTRLDSSSTQ